MIVTHQMKLQIVAHLVGGKGHFRVVVVCQGDGVGSLVIDSALHRVSLAAVAIKYIAIGFFYTAIIQLHPCGAHVPGRGAVRRKRRHSHSNSHTKRQQSCKQFSLQFHN